ncbi:Transposon TX1 uncharacterized 149 kDa protein [Vitis vinifera]|uniref:Transposon TX1 uncharacterized 149 kDa protein n=1 Tax=Vitis vinifera TaxID=29760 RepID=A0A438KBL6_VITVI|nr:Transposon TX1 uncharacterized 149 kDa protein [Vitis vinifera]
MGPDFGSLMKLRLLSWNVRGANDSSKRKVIKAMIRNQRVDLFYLQETKIQTMSEGVVRSLGSGRFLDWGAMDAHRSAGGILICWDKRTVEVLEMEVGHFSISCRLRNVEDGLVWIFTGVYGPFFKEDREALWEELGAIRGFWNDPWCLGGDFNVILSQRERSSQGRISGAMRRFAHVVDELELLDLSLQGGVFSWSGGGGLRRGLSSFRFENMWLKVDGFKDLLRGWWQGSRVSGRANFRLATKLKQLLSEEPGWKADIEGLHLQSLNSSEAEGLELPFTEEEIHSARLEMNGDKAPGSDEFTVAFWQFCWDFVKEEIVDLFKEFYEQRSFVKSLNTTFLILIPKKRGAEDLGDFRPISLLGGLYKLLAKVLVNRLKKVLGKVVSVDQNAFHQLEFSHEGFAQDGLWVSMDGVDLVVHFNCQIFCLGQWGASRLLEFQGAASRRSFVSLPLCPGYGSAKCTHKKAVVGGFISGCSLRGRGRMEMDVSHLLFSDDTIIFCEARKEYLISLNWILAWFEATSRLRINLAKSELIPVWEKKLRKWQWSLGAKWGLFLQFIWGCPLEPTTRPYLCGMGWKKE